MTIDEQLVALGLEPVNMVDITNEIADRGRIYAQGVDIPLTSSNVAKVRYSKASNTLYVQFDNGREKAGPRLYAYSGFSGLEDVYDMLWSAGSPGGVVWDNLRRPGITFTRL